MSLPGPQGGPSAKSIPPVSGAGATNIKELFGYIVHSRLGVGARSIVYLVSDPATQQRYALKRIVRDDPELDDPAIEQMKNEFEIGRRLSHANLRKCLELFVIKKLLVFGIREVALLMELVDGISLVDKRTYSLAVLADIFRQTAEGLHAMHQTGFVHADMKPHNIIVSEARLVKIVDYGQSCPNGTVKSRIQGTPEFIAPEQVKRGPIDPRTDVYNLGATMYWALTGKHLPSPLDVYKNLQAGVLTALPSTTSPPSAINPRVLPEWDALIMKCVKHDKKERPADMGVVASRLQTVLDEYLAKDPKALELLRRDSSSKSLSASGSSDELPKSAADKLDGLSSSLGRSANSQDNTNGESEIDIDVLDRELEAKLGNAKRLSQHEIHVGLEDSTAGVSPLDSPSTPAKTGSSSTAAATGVDKSNLAVSATSSNAISRSVNPTAARTPTRPSKAATGVTAPNKAASPSSEQPPPPPSNPRKD